MITITFNIGYAIDGAGGILSHYPILWRHKSFKAFSKAVRSKTNVKTLFDWAKQSHVPPSSMLLTLNIQEDDVDFEWKYTIRLINVREYRKHWELKYKKEWKEPEAR